ncbi:hypothetical protein AOQ84DRAFT_346315 [Glonium stellatum]|uniref:RBR-type E3 ubiquitin transferase n=1 Tax=Glonium stellatum TaxID=574774 RepID=A0A8E2ETM9_9PEZI|nr:hypothetical protein AOQ84DRAFT_346315 [Glonium stellatum]
MLRELDELEHQTETLERMLARLPPEWMILKIGKMVHAYISQNFRNALKMIKSITVSVIGGITLLLSPPEKSCIICTDAKPVGKFPRGKITANCEHEPQVCLKDLKTWITLELKSKGWESISCPECKEPLRHSDIRKFASRKTFARYETLMTRAALSADPNFRWCLNPSCDSGQIHKIRRNGPKFRCDECKKRFCMFHERPWHEGETCQQFDRRAVVERQKAEEAASAAVIGRTTKKCPGKPGQPCGWNIEKAAGCDHMTCLKCAGEFCYICLAFYGPIRKQGNSMHLPTCRYHSDNIPRQ